MTNTINIFAQTPPPDTTSIDFTSITKDFNTQVTTDWSIPEAFLCLLFSAANADGMVSDEEREEIFALVHRSRSLKGLTPQQLGEVNAAINQRLATRPDGLQEACASLPMDMRLSVFAHCVDIILADGKMLQTEADFLNTLVGAMHLQPADAKRVLDVILIKNRY